MKKGIVIFKSMPEHFNVILFRQNLAEKFPDVLLEAVVFGAENGLKMIEKIRPGAVFTVYFTLFEPGGIATRLTHEVMCSFDIIYLEVYRGSRIRSAEFFFKEYMQEAFGIGNSPVPEVRISKVPGDYHSLLIRKIRGAVRLQKRDILRMESKNNYTRIFLKNKKDVTASKTLKQFESALQHENFIRIHQSHLVNLKHIKKVNPREGSVVLSDGKKIRIARRQKHKFFEAYRRMYR
jgi:two-component system LytT family response regulator